MNGVHQPHDLVLAFFSASGLLFAVWIVAITRGLWSHGRSGHGLQASLSPGRYLVLAIANADATLRDAGVTLYAPAVCRPLVRLGLDGSPKGQTASVQEVLEPQGEPVEALRWHEKGLHILGGDNTTEYMIIANPPPGDYPVKLRVYDDADTVRDAEFFLTATFPPPAVDHDRRRQFLEGHRRHLDRNRFAVVRALGRGHYWPPHEVWIHRDQNPRFWPQLDATGTDTHLCEVLGDAYEESARLDSLVETRPGDEPILREGDHAERTLATILHALVLVDIALRDAA